MFGLVDCPLLPLDSFSSFHVNLLKNTEKKRMSVNLTYLCTEKCVVDILLLWMALLSHCLGGSVTFREHFPLAVNLGDVLKHIQTILG